MIVIGKSREIYNDQTLPSIKDNQRKLDSTTKEKIIGHLKTGKITASSPAILRDVFTEEPLGSPLYMQTDGKYAWRSDVLYYFEKYDLDLGEEFIKDVTSR